MQLVKGLVLAAVVCVAQVSAGNAEQQTGKHYGIKDSSASSASASASTSASDSDDSETPVQNGFDVHQVKFTSSDPEGDDKKEEDEGSSSHVPLIAAVGACACIGVLGTVYIKRRKYEEKLGGEIFTIDDKNSVL